MSFTRRVSIRRILRNASAALAFFAALVAFHATASAATLSISPSSSTATVGKTVSVRVVVGSGGESINAVSGEVHFPADLLTLTGISKSGIVTLWAQDPTYSNSAGTATFQGVILNGYTGGAGTVVTLTFKTKAEGTAMVTLSSANSSVLLNDGNGTNVLSNTNGGSITINAATTPPPATTKPEQPAENEEPVVTPPAEAPTPDVPPAFTDYQNPLSPGDFIVAKGTASKDSIVTITFTKIVPDSEAIITQTKVPTTDTGTFTFVSDEKAVEGGTYTLVATTEDGQHTPELRLSVKNSIRFVITAWVMTLLAIQMPVVYAILILILISGYLLYRNHMLKKHLQEAIEALHQAQEPK